MLEINRALADNARVVNECLEKLLPMHQGLEARLHEAFRYSAL